MTLGALTWAACLLACASGCRKTPAPPGPQATRPAEAPRRSPEGKAALPGPTKQAYKVVHVFVALCDNKNQGIAPVPEALGNGQDPKNNLYWGAMYGLKTFFRRSGHWREVPAGEVAVVADGREAILDTAVFVSTGRGPKVYVLAEAFDGARMDAAVGHFFDAAAGRLSCAVAWGKRPRQVLLLAGRGADMVCFVGHNGLMDHTPASFPRRAHARGPTCAVVLACKSNAHFAAPLRQAGCTPLITTSGLMAPEAYTLDAIIRSWAAGADAAGVHLRAAEAYAKYQKCSLKAAKALFVAPGR